MAEERVIKIGMLGLGTVGTGVYKVLKSQQEEMLPKLGARVELKKILVRNVEKAAAKVDDPSIITTSFEEIANDPEIEIVVEVMGGIEPAYTFVKRALQAGKSVSTSNKALVAKHGSELMEIAKEKNINFLFEASCGGGIPIIRALNSSLTADEIDEITGILNGTTNYMLYKMSTENCDFDTVLKEAQAKGYAEADPTADVGGADACRKIAILSSLAYGKFLNYEDIYTEGITKITAKDIEYAKEFDSVIKLLGVAHNTESGIEVGVYPMMIHKEHPLASVRDSFNAVFVHGDAADDAMFYGRGAGEFPTASAVMGDVIDVARNMAYGCNGRISCTCYKNLPVKDIGDVKNKFFIRMQVTNEPGVLAAVAEVFGNHKVSITRVVQEHTQPHQAELVIVTESVKEKYMKQALEELLALPSILEVSSIIREY